MTERRPAPLSRASRLARSPLTAVSAALALFFVTFTLLTARVVTGTDPGLRAAASAQVVSGHGRTILRTTASGRVIRETAPGSNAPGAVTASLLTHASGGGTDE
jgi:hypothetical protein